MSKTVTTSEILHNIDLAINAKVTGIINGEVKEFTIRDKRIIEHSLEDLRKLRAEFQALASAVANDGLRKVVFRNRGL